MLNRVHCHLVKFQNSTTKSGRHVKQLKVVKRRNTTIFSNFRIGVRRKFSTTTTTEPSTVSTTVSRPTKIKLRRKYLTRSTTKRLESQESTTPMLKPDNRFRFVPRKPTRRPTQKPKDSTVEPSSYQTSSGDEQPRDKSTELTDLAAALQSIQKAPIPQKSAPEITLRLPQTTERHVNKLSKIPQTTPRNINSRGTRPQVILNKAIVPTAPISSPQPFRAHPSTSPSPLFITFQSTATPVQHQAYRKVTPSVSTSYSPSSDYDFYQTADGGTVAHLPEHSKVLLHSNGVIECLDQGNFPHPASCRKFISCAEMGVGRILGWEYTCPKNLSFDPIGGICNWSADVGCDER